MSALTAINVQHHCRTCLCDLQKNVDEIGLPRQWCHVETTEYLSDWIMNFTSLHVLATSSNFPQFVCQECYMKFKDFHEFRQLVWQSAKRLDAILGGATLDCGSEDEEKTKHIRIKEEPTDEELGGWNKTHDANSFLSDELLEATELQMEPQMLNKFESFNTEYITSHADPLFNNEPTEEQEKVPTLTKSYKCTLCNRSYAHKYTYIAHIRQDHQGIDRAFECDQCHKSYTKFSNLYRHMRLDHNMALRQFKCEYPKCNRSFRQLATRRKHYEDHHDERASKRPPTTPSPPDSTLLLPELLTTSSLSVIPAASTITAKRYICSLCSASFETLYNLKNHMIDHRDDLKFVCTLCGTRKISQLKLDEHYANVHDPKNSYPCTICHKVFKCKSHVSVHILSVHKGLRPFACHYCPSHFAAKNTLKIHERIHTGEKPFACEVCGRRFTQLTPMKKHRQTHENSAKGVSQSLPGAAIV